MYLITRAVEFWRTCCWHNPKDYYKSDLKIRTTIAKVIRKFANEGNAIIVGRGGVAITRDIPLSLHIFLEAPWNGGHCG